MTEPRGIEKRDTSRAGLERRLRCGWRIRELQRQQWNRLAPGLPPNRKRAFRTDFYRRHAENDAEVNRLLALTYWADGRISQNEVPDWYYEKVIAASDNAWDAIVAPRSMLALPKTLPFAPDTDPAENFQTTWTEDDVPANRLAFVTTTATGTAMDDDEVYRGSRDMGAGHFGAAFAHLFHFKVTVQSGYAASTYGLTNTIAKGGTLWGVHAQAVWVRWYANCFGLFDAEDWSGDEATLVVDKDYYCELVRSNGGATLTCYIYLEATHDTLVDSIATAISGARTYQYAMILNGWGTGNGGAAMTEIVSDVDFQEAVPGNPWYARQLMARRNE